MADPEEENRDETAREGRFLPYPVSTLSPQILPTDLSTFKSRGAGKVQRHFQQRLQELREQYIELVDQFNWSKLIYESHFAFEPQVGETYHLYDLGDDGRYTLSMIAPEQWKSKKWIGTFRLNSDGEWQPLDVAGDFDLQKLAGEE